LGGSVVLLASFVVVERRSEEPVVPLRLFANPVFAVTSGIGLIVGFALFGSVTYLPVFLRLVRGSSPTASGLELVPMMAGMLATSISSGQIISRIGRYKLFPIAGTMVLAVGLFLLSRMRATTSGLTAGFFMLIVGMGLGLVMQVLVLAVQNAVEYEDLGVATSGATLFRLVGGSFGVAVLGAIFSSRLAANLARAFPGAPQDVEHISPAVVLRLPPAARGAGRAGAAPGRGRRGRRGPRGGGGGGAAPARGRGVPAPGGGAVEGRGFPRAGGRERRLGASPAGGPRRSPPPAHCTGGTH